MPSPVSDRTPLRASRSRLRLVTLLVGVVLAAATSTVAIGATPAEAVSSSPGQTVGHVVMPRTVLGRNAEVLRLINRARAHARSCGGKHYGAVGPLRTNALLTKAARAFAVLMGTRDFFDHVAPDGSDPGDRLSLVGYHWRRYGENIAAGYTRPAAVVQAWLASPGHCANIMTPFKEVGIGYAVRSTSTYGSYWVMEFGTR